MKTVPYQQKTLYEMELHIDYVSWIVLSFYLNLIIDLKIAYPVQISYYFRSAQNIE